MNIIKVLPSNSVPNVSEKEILSMVQRLGPIARSDMAGHSRLSQQSVHRIVEGLVARGFIRYGEAKIKGRGKPSPHVELNTDTHASLGVSFTTETVKISLLDLAGNALWEEALPTSPADPQSVFAILEKRLGEFVADGPLCERLLIGVGIAMQGYRTGEADRFNVPVPLASWQQQPIAQLFADRLACPAFVENNATSSAIAEQLIGGGAGFNCFGYLSFNYGFGGGFIWNRRPVFGGHGNAGELTTIFEGVEVTRRPALGELIQRLQARNVAIKNVSELSDAFDPDWPGVREWIEEVTPAMRLCIRAIKAVMDPNAIFFGGEAPDLLRKMLIEAGKTPQIVSEGPDPLLLCSKISGDSAHIGAALLPLQRVRA